MSVENFFKFLRCYETFVLIIEETIALLNIECLVTEEDLFGNLDLPLVFADELDKSQEHEIFYLTLFFLKLPALLLLCLTCICFVSFTLNTCLFFFDLALNLGSFLSSCLLVFFFLLLLLFSGHI